MHIDAASPTPVFEQIIEQLRRGAVQGSLPAGTRLPAVRALAGELGVAVNTVAKAYRQLEAEGTVVTGGRNGTTIAGLADAEPHPGGRGGADPDRPCPRRRAVPRPGLGPGGPSLVGRGLVAPVVNPGPGGPWAASPPAARAGMVLTRLQL